MQTLHNSARQTASDLYVALPKANLPNTFKDVVLQKKTPPKEYLAERGILGSEPVAKGWAFWAFNGVDYLVVRFYAERYWKQYNDVVEYTGDLSVGEQIPQEIVASEQIAQESAA